jgi:hypothetical protein
MIKMAYAVVSSHSEEGYERRGIRFGGVKSRSGECSIRCVPVQLNEMRRHERGGKQTEQMRGQKGTKVKRKMQRIPRSSQEIYRP